MNLLVGREALTGQERRDTMNEELRTLIELLGVRPIQVRDSVYQGIELVLNWAPDYRVITVIGLGSTRIFCCSKQPFSGAFYNGMGDWILHI